MRVAATVRAMALPAKPDLHVAGYEDGTRPQGSARRFRISGEEPVRGFRPSFWRPTAGTALHPEFAPARSVGWRCSLRVPKRNARQATPCARGLRTRERASDPAFIGHWEWISSPG